MTPVELCGGAVAAAALDRLTDVPVPAPDRADVAARPATGRAEVHAARVLLRRLLAEVAGPGAAAASLRARPHGQPYLADRPEIGISLSHTDGWVAVAVHPGAAVGVDIQAPVPVGDGLLRKCCTPATREVLAGLPAAARAAAFARVWTVQEACVKVTGRGIAGLPWTIPVEPCQHRGRWGDVRWTALPDRWPLPVAFAHLAGRTEGACRCPT